MNEVVKETLYKIVARYGIRYVTDEPRRLKNLLLDLCYGAHKGQINLLVLALEAQVVTQLLGTMDHAPSQDLVARRLTTMLSNDYYVNETSARWAVDAWIYALRQDDAPRTDTKHAVTKNAADLFNARRALNELLELRLQQLSHTITTIRASDGLSARQSHREIKSVETKFAAPQADRNTLSNTFPRTLSEKHVPSLSTTPHLKRGEVVEGIIVGTSPLQITVEVNGLQGVIPGHELEKMSKSLLEELKEGATVTVFVVNPRGHGGYAELSVNRALEELDWRRTEEFRHSQQVYESRVAGYNKGGLIVRFGRVRGFVPQSQMSAERRRLLSGETPEERWGKMVNEVIAVKVMEVDRARNRLILSERSASRESREKRKENLISQLTKGEVRTGRVVSLEDFGAFVDIGGAEGLVYLTELSWKHVNHPRELLQVGQEVKVEVISIDRDQKRIGLSIKSQEQDPWDIVAINYNVGQLVKAWVIKLTKFGVFARLVDIPEIEGLIHISELSEKPLIHPREIVQEGDCLTLRVINMDIANRRLALSIYP